MKTPRSLALAFLLSAGSLFAADSAVPELRGVLSLSGQQRFSLSNPSATETAWVGVGDEFQGWKLVSYKAQEETLVLAKDGQEKQVRLLSGSVQHQDAVSTKATLADAQEVIRKMNFEAMLRKTIEQQKSMSAQMAKQMAQRMGATNISDEDFTAHQNKLMGILFSDETIRAMSDDMTRIYSEVFSAEELRGMSDFYSTTVGKSMLDKTPAVQEKLSQTMMPRMMASMTKIQELTKEFMQQQAAKQQAAKAAKAATEPAAPATPTPAPGK